ncbi:MAG: hypothetical protein BWX86_00417 [Verrucomicrobia bacterium ADurb.Bin122]|nr:MAG: hypothetical protein BWX86_00417 [Verrucomicrobia bacterium ADurb.Bin122]
MIRRLALSAGLLLTSALSAAPLVRELGDGLGYARIAQLPDDLPDTAKVPGPALVLDLRNVPATTDTANAFALWLTLQDRAKAPLLVLLNPDTAPLIREVLHSQAGRPGILTLGPTTPDYAPDIVVPISADADRLAYAALDNTCPIADLVPTPTSSPPRPPSRPPVPTTSCSPAPSTCTAPSAPSTASSHGPARTIERRLKQRPLPWPSPRQSAPPRQPSPRASIGHARFP